MVVVIGNTLSHFRIKAGLGTGGMGEVFRAEDLKLGREVAVKVLPPELARDPESLQHFYSEAKILAALSHPNIITIFSVEEEEGAHFLVTELVEGKSLDQLIPPEGMSLNQILELAIPLSGALHAAHAAGITHRDLKPANVMVSENNQVKVLDFGLARRIIASPGVVSKERTGPLDGTGMISGTIQYMSPEQLMGKPLDPRSDIFSFGIMLYEMVTGTRPFQGAAAAAVISSILRDDPPILTDVRPGLPARLAWLVKRCLEKDVNRRLQSMLDAHNELEDLRRIGQEHLHHSIAVLPFRDISSGHEQEYFCEGIAEELINALSKVEGVRVVSRISSFRYRKADLDIREIGRRLNVSTVLEGSVRKSDSRLRITAQLVNVEDGYTLWSERYEREVKDIFAIQDEISQSIVQALKVTLTPHAEERIRRESTTNVQAYDFYLRGKKFYEQYGKQDVEFALQMYSRAIEADPEYARAYAGIAECCCYLYMNAGKHDTDLKRADEASRRALELAPDLAEASTARGTLLSLSQRHEEAREAFENAIRLDPRLFEARYFYARDCFAQGKLEEAVRIYEQAASVRPYDYQVPLLVAQIYDDLHKKDEAAASRRRGIRLAEEHLILYPDDVRAIYMAANGMAALGQKERSLEWVKRALNLRPNEPMVLYNAACVYALAGELEDALDCLEEAFKQGFYMRSWIDHDSNLDSIRNHPQFLDLLSRIS